MKIMKLMNKFFTVILLYLFVAVQVQASENIYPKNLGEFKRNSLIRGEKAIRSVMKLHRGAKIQMKDAVVADYMAQNGKKLIIWASLSPSKEQAHALINRMNEKIPSSGMYRNLNKLNYKGVSIYSVDGMGMQNYYFVKGKWNYWLSVKNAEGRSVLNKFIGNLLSFESME